MPPTLQFGKPNKKGQVLIERTKEAGSNNQTLYLLKCSKCGTEHKTNGANVSTSRCPNPLCSIGIAKKLNPITARTLDPGYTFNFEEIRSRIVELFSSVGHISMVRDCTLKEQKNPLKNRLILTLDLYCGVSIEGKLKIIEEGGRIIEAMAPELRKQESKIWQEVWEINREKISSLFPPDIRNEIRPLRQAGTINVPGLGEFHCKYGTEEWTYLSPERFEYMISKMKIRSWL